MSCEENYIRNTENAFRSLRLKTKDEKEVMKTIGFNLNKLKEVNEGLYLDYLQQYKLLIKK